MGVTTAAQAGVTIDERIGMFDSQGTLREQAREVWNLVEPQVESVARAFWTRYAQSPDLDHEIGGDKIARLTQRIIPYLRLKFEDVGSQKWVDIARDYVATAAAAHVPLTTLVAGATAAAAVAT